MSSMPKFDLYIDFDGCLGSISTYYTKKGKRIKAVAASDSLVINLLRQVGIINKVTVITGDMTGYEITKARVNDLGFDLVYCKNNKKFKYIEEKCNGDFSNIIYIGDDIYDVVLFDKVKYSGAPKSAIPFVKEYANYISDCNGGEGAVGDLLIKMTNDILAEDNKSFIDLVYENTK